jgi:hypothetical protein
VLEMSKSGWSPAAASCEFRCICENNILLDYKEDVCWDYLNQDGILQPRPVNLDVFVKVISCWILKRMCVGTV